MLVGRESERRTIATVLAAARVADSRALVLAGEAGIGKTALLQEARSLAGEMRVLSAQGVDSERYVPFAGLLQVLRPVLGLLEDIPAAQRTALASALALGPVPDQEPSRFAVGAATLSLVARAAEDRPLLLLVDDAHLLDAPSAEALVFAARRMLSDAVAVLVAVRPDEPGARVLDSLPVLLVPGLDMAAAGSLLATAGDPVARERLQRLHQVTAGNPLALLELCDQLERLDDLPPSAPVPVPEQVTRSFLRRVSGLPRAARTTLTVAAADPSSLRTVLMAARRIGVRDPTLASAQDAGLVTLAGDAIEFRHPLVQAAVYADAEPALRREVHRALAHVVDPTDVHRLTWHLSEGAAGPDEETAALLERVASEAAARSAHTIAMHAYERAAVLSLDPGLVPRRLASAGEAAWLGGRTDRATELLGEALSARPAPLLRAHVQELQGAVQLRAGSVDLALQILTRAAIAVAPLEPERAVRINADVVHAAFYLMDPGAAMEACRRIDRLLAGDISPATRLLGRSASGMAMVLAGAGAAGVDRLREAAYRLVVPDPPAAERFRLPLRLQGALWLRGTGPEREVVADTLESMREDAAVALLPYLLMQVARDAATSDRWDVAESSYHEAARLAQEIGLTTDFAVSVAGLAIVEARRGRAGAVAEHVEAAGELAARNGVRLATVWLAFAQGDLAAGSGDLESAAEHYTGLEELLAATGLSDPDQSCAPELVECLVHLRRGPQAVEVAAGFASRAAAKGQSWSLARSARAAALCADDPEPDYREALELHAETPDGYEAARTRLAYGAWLRRARRRVDARPLLVSALETFDRLDATPWADRAARELAATGETVQRDGAGTRVELTPQERQIALLLAQGRTTRQAAAGLFLSPKTVEYHLRHVYLKLGISSRAELAERFTGRGE
ncbi:helix-turn-helix transcriptional regulator [Nocardioides dokdonensis]|uniref:helix-turn-helix transcriptional regulator n=1 Tax=Nocardioides dokdonensis TaxID=450734 RepID=UPI0008312380|nr:helix-turn-helix transcriptional regulator [Nocardioides dokdonensis]